MLNLQNKHSNDSRITFDSRKHEYFVDGKSIKYSVTGLIEKFFPKFDSDYWSNKKAIERIQIEGGNLTITGPKGTKTLTINDKIF